MPNSKKIIIYSTPTCPYCDMAKDYLKEKGFEFSIIDVASNVDEAKKMVEKTGQMGVPVLEIDGQIVIGFDKNKIDELLNIKQ